MFAIGVGPEKNTLLLKSFTSKPSYYIEIQSYSELVQKVTDLKVSFQSGCVVVGEPGRDGFQGSDGADGEPGEKGKRGASPQGIPGANAAKGQKGEPAFGFQGRTGNTGLPGVRGDRGMSSHISVYICTVLNSSASKC